MFIETYIIRLLTAFAEYGTLTRVGEELGITQPTISRSMQKLEAELGVTLFDRTKNRISLNENGVFAAEYAKKIMALQGEMIEKTRDKAGLHKKFAVGSVAIQPAVNAARTAERVYAGIEAKYDIDDDETHLIRGLTDDVYQLIILLHPLEGNDYKSERYFSEHLSVMLPKSHRLASRTTLALSDLAGETFVMYDDIGFWDTVKRRKIPDAKFVRLVRQNEHDPISAVIAASDMPSFISDRTTSFTLPENRVAIPLTDEEMNVTFYAVCKRERADEWRALLLELAKDAG